MVYPRDRHSGIADHFRYQPPIKRLFHPIRDGNASNVPSLANEIDDRPALLPTLQALQRQFRKLAAAQSATEQDGQDRSITLSGQSLSIGYLPERRRLAGCKPVAQT